MNVKITSHWLLEYLETNSDPYELQKDLSLCGPSVERVDKMKNDYVLDIETTSNRVDTACVFGVAQEARAILPQFGKKAQLKFNPLAEFKFAKFSGANKLDIRIKNPQLCSRFAALVLSNVSIKQASEIIRKRLQLCGIKSINNVIDISNYLMLSLGQPTHIFDYDKIGKQTMILRESKKGEKIVTLDKKEITLPGGDIVIEDGNGDLIDLCGIMGGLNSSVNEETRNVLLFVQTYNKQKIRRTSMLTGQRTMAATYFEKGLDEERVEPTLVYGVELLKKETKAIVSSALYDIYPAPYKTKSLTISLDYIQRRIGVELETKKVKQMLENLGFAVKSTQDHLTVGIPSWRKDDIKIKEDLVEEIARLFGYHNLPMNLPAPAYVKRSPQMEALFEMQNKIKYLLKRLGMHEVMNYSMISKEMLENMHLELKNHLKLANPISEDLLYMRTSLLPSLVKNLKDNQGKRTFLRFFEIAKVYYPQVHNLPKEIYKLALATNTSFSDIKGIVESLLSELNIANYEVKTFKTHTFSKNEVVDFVVNENVLGSVGKLTNELQYKNGLKSAAYLANFDLQALIDHAKTVAKYRPINPYAVIKLDLTIPIKVYAYFAKKAHETSPYLQKVELIDSFKDKKTVRFYFSSTERNLTEKEAQAELEKIKQAAR